MSRISESPFRAVGTPGTVAACRPRTAIGDLLVDFARALDEQDWHGYANHAIRIDGDRATTDEGGVSSR